MKRKIFYFCVIILLFSLSTVSYGGGEQTNLGISIKGGLNRLEGDLAAPLLKPFVYGSVEYNLFDFLAVGVEGGYSMVGGKEKEYSFYGVNELKPEFQTNIFPYEGHVKFSFLPLGKINPYVILGGGGFYWEYTEGDSIPAYTGTTKLKKGYDSFLKSGGGVEILLNNKQNLYFNLGVTFRYSLTDMLDDIHSDELTHKDPLNDGLIDFYGGFTYYIRTTTRGDRDNDGVPDELDLKSEIPEDPNGYLDHDGKPDGAPPAPILSSTGMDTNTVDTDPPIVLHKPIHRVEEGSNIYIRAKILEDRSLKVASVIYRPLGDSGWKVGQLRRKEGSLYEGIIPSRFVKRQGLEYCVIAVDEAISGVGYCGLPRLPVRTEVISHPKMWRIISGTAALLGWGTSSYLIFKKQN